MESVVSPTYDVVFVGSNFLAIFEELQPRLWVSLGLADHAQPLSLHHLQTLRV